ncbi:WRKY domain [Dillenia turbinata]|uniref:WRKY domain n=1 Tax=Dillenia turbinata TaxID=194707 RepID=A0AAN8UF66_9MAGN
MSGTNFLAAISPESDFAGQTSLELSDEFLLFDDWPEEDPPLHVSASTESPANPIKEVGESGGKISLNEGPSNRESGSIQEKKEVKERVAFKTKSDVEILDDGFKWRKYGKKMVKNSPNPRQDYALSCWNFNAVLAGRWKERPARSTNSKKK